MAEKPRLHGAFPDEVCKEGSFWHACPISLWFLPQVGRQALANGLRKKHAVLLVPGIISSVSRSTLPSLAIRIYEHLRLTFACATPSGRASRVGELQKSTLLYFAAVSGGQHPWYPVHLLWCFRSNHPFTFPILGSSHVCIWNSSALWWHAKKHGSRPSASISKLDWILRELKYALLKASTRPRTLYKATGQLLCFTLRPSLSKYIMSCFLQALTKSRLFYFV